MGKFFRYVESKKDELGNVLEINEVKSIFDNPDEAAKVMREAQSNKEAYDLRLKQKALREAEIKAENELKAKEEQRILDYIKRYSLKHYMIVYTYVASKGLIDEESFDSSVETILESGAKIGTLGFAEAVKKQIYKYKEMVKWFDLCYPCAEEDK